MVSSYTKIIIFIKCSFVLIINNNHSRELTNISVEHSTSKMMFVVSVDSEYTFLVATRKKIPNYQNGNVINMRSTVKIIRVIKDRRICVFFTLVSCMNTPSNYTLFLFKINRCE